MLVLDPSRDQWTLTSNILNADVAAVRGSGVRVPKLTPKLHPHTTCW